MHIECNSVISVFWSAFKILFLKSLGNRFAQSNKPFSNADSVSERIPCAHSAGILQWHSPFPLYLKSLWLHYFILLRPWTTSDSRAPVRSVRSLIPPHHPHPPLLIRVMLRAWHGLTVGVGDMLSDKGQRVGNSKVKSARREGRACLRDAQMMNTCVRRAS